jgi:Tfp pilus assembly protein PilN
MDNIDFLPQAIRNKRTRRRRLIRQGYLLGLCALAIVALGYIRQGRVSAAMADVRLLQECTDNVQRQSARRLVLEQRLQDLALKQRIEERLGTRIGAQLVLAEIQHQMPASICLLSMELETLDVQLPRKNDTNATVRAAVTSGDRKPDTIKRLRVTLTGLAPNDVDVANFIGQLSASPVLEDVNMGYTKSVTYKGRLAREFRASCYVAR